MVAKVLQVDVVVAGGSLSAVAAALAVARANPDVQILLTEPTDWLGGQATSQGVSAPDNAWHEPARTLMRDNRALYYPADYNQFIQAIKAAPKAAPGEGYGGEECNWVSREAFDPRTAAWVLDDMVAPYENLHLLKMTVVKDVASAELDGSRRVTGLRLIQRFAKPGYTQFSKMLSVELPDWYSPSESPDFAKLDIDVQPRDSARGLVVVDATEFGDVMVLSGADYMIGRERTTEDCAPDGSLPAMDECGSQAFVFPFCMTSALAPDAEADARAMVPDFDAYYARRSADWYDLKAFTWQKVWTYRRLKNTGKPGAFDTVNAGDVTMQNWEPGNDYPDGTLFKDQTAARAEIAGGWQGGVNIGEIAEAEKCAIGFYFFMKFNRPTTFDTHLCRGSDTLNMMGTASGLSKFPYVRCGRRSIGIGNFRITQKSFADITKPGNAERTSLRFFDSVGIGCYAVDVHATKGSEGVPAELAKPAPFHIPYRALTSRNVANLLVAGKNMAQTFYANSAYRLHPIEWASGSAAGVAAVMMWRESLSNEALLELPRLRALQRAVSINSPIHWAAYDATALPPNDSDDSEGGPR